MTDDSCPLSVLHVLAPGVVGGLESVVRALTTGLARREHRVAVAAILERDPADAPFLAALEAGGVHVERVVAPGRAYRAERRRVAEICRARGVAVVHTHGYRPDVVDTGVARRLGLPTVTTVHGFVGGGGKNRIYEWLQVRAFRRIDAVVAVSRPLVETLAARGVPRARLELLPNAYGAGAAPVDRAAARSHLGLPDAGFVVGWVGRLSREKGADVLLDALAQLRDLSVTVAIVGDGPEREALRAQAAALGVGDRLVWCGVVPDAGRYGAAFDVFALSSRTEGTPIALFEAMAVGTPIVATRVGGVPDVVTPGEAVVVPPESPAELAAAIRDVHHDPEAARRRADAACRRLRDAYGVEPWLDRYAALYRRLLTR